MTIRSCANCGVPFFAYRENQRFGSPRCCRAAWALANGSESSQERLPTPVRCRATVPTTEPFLAAVRAS